MTKERPPLLEMTLRQLRRVASEFGISRYSRMRKDQLLSSIQAIQRHKFLPTPSQLPQAQQEVEAAKFEVGQPGVVAQAIAAVKPLANLVQGAAALLATVDEDLGELPEGYGESRIVLMPRDPQWAYAYWDVTNEHKEDLRRQGGYRLALRFYDVTEIDFDFQRPHSVQQYECDEIAREWYLPIPVSDRDYAAEIGYICGDGRWLVLARSAPVRIPPVYPSDWIEDTFITVNWEEDLQDKQFVELVPPSRRMAAMAAGNGAATGRDTAVYDQIFGMAESVEAQRIAGSLYGSMQQAQVPQQAISSFVFPSGVGMWASGMGMSGVGSASMPAARPRQFWLVADAELIVYGATEPNATVTIGGRPIKLNSDGTFRFQMSFQDGLIDYPIMAVAADGEQTRSIHMEFTRETPERTTNTKAEAVEEWLA